LSAAARRGQRARSAALRGWPALLLLALAAACSPAADWREVRPAGLRLQLALPCRPDAVARRLPLAGAEVELQLYACSAGGSTFALASADLDDPQRVGAALAELGAAARANVRGRIVRDDAAAVGGMTPHQAARRWRIAGSLPDGREVVQEVAVFAYGSRVYQATVVGAQPDAAAVQTLFDSLKVTP